MAEALDSRENCLGRKLLMFHGIILRSQLIELLKHKVFFNESDGVSIHTNVQSSAIVLPSPVPLCTLQRCVKVGVELTFSGAPLICVLQAKRLVIKNQ